MKTQPKAALSIFVGLALLLLTTASLGVHAQRESPRVELDLVAGGLTSPVDLASPGDGSGRLFVVDQVGLVKVIDSDGELVEEPFLDLRERIVDLDEGYDERGLLGLTFHPNYEENGRFYVYYSAPSPEGTSGPNNHTSHVSEFTVSDGDPERANPDSEEVLMRVNQPQMNHNGGGLAFGPEGYLYIGLGDGGAANDVAPGHPPLGNGQDVTTLKGSILRIDVDGGEPYGIPEDNPLVGTEGKDEIFAYGFRNPWRFSFDSGGERELFVADVGQNLFEEVSLVRKGGNYGWNIKEGVHCFDPEDPNDPPEECADTGPHGRELEDPIIEYAHPGTGMDVMEVGNSITGGFVYRGSDLPELRGSYVFGDWSTSFREADGKITVASPPEREGDLWPIREVEIANTESGQLEEYLLAFGRDEKGEIYALTTENAGPSGSTGKVYRLAPTASGGTPSETMEEETAEESPVTVAVEGGEWYFEPETITVKKGREVTIEFENAGSFPHNLMVGEFDAKTETVGNGETTSVTFTADEAGRFPFWCAISGHRGRGMEGTLVVED